MNVNKRLKIPQRTHPLVAQLFEIIRDHPTETMASTTRKAGLGTGAIGNWAKYHNPQVPNFDAALQVLGYKLAIVPVDTPDDPS